MTDLPPEDPKQPPRSEAARTTQRSQDAKRGSMQRVRMEVASWDGPIPPPAILREIEEIVPGAAKRIIDQFEAEALHRRTLQRRTQWLPFVDLVFARVSGLLFAAGCLLLIGYAISQGAGWAAAVLSAALVVGGINAIMARR